MKFIALTALVAVLVLSASASADGPSYGLLGGLSRSQFDFTTTMPYSADPGSRSGVRVGLFAEHSLYGPVYAHLGLNYHDQGWEVNRSVDGADTQQNPSEPISGRPEGLETFAPSIRYVEIPLLVKVRPEMGKVDPFAMLGPRLDIRVGQSDDPEWDGRYDDFRKIQWGVTVGGGAEVDLSRRLSAVFGVIYNHAFEEAYTATLAEDWSLTIDRSSIDFVTGVRF